MWGQKNMPNLISHACESLWIDFNSHMLSCYRQLKLPTTNMSAKLKFDFQNCPSRSEDSWSDMAAMQNNSRQQYKQEVELQRLVPAGDIYSLTWTSLISGVFGLGLAPVSAPVIQLACLHPTPPAVSTRCETHKWCKTLHVILRQLDLLWRTFF